MTIDKYKRCICFCAGELMGWTARSFCNATPRTVYKPGWFSILGYARAITSSRQCKETRGSATGRALVLLNKVWCQIAPTYFVPYLPPPQCVFLEWAAERLTALGNLWRAHMAHGVNNHQSALPVAQAAVLALPPSSQAKVSVVSLMTYSHVLRECTND